MADINEGGVARALARRFGIQGPYSPGLEEVIVPIVQVDTLHVPLGATAIRGAWVGTDVGAAVGFVSESGIINPVGSGVLVRVRRCDISCSAAIRARVRSGSPAGTLSTSQLFLKDRRLGDRAASAMQTANDHASGAGDIVAQARILADTVVPVEFDVVLSEGVAIHVDSNSQNVDFTCSWHVEEISNPEAFAV
jgi:hypothetical protein